MTPRIYIISPHFNISIWQGDKNPEIDTS